MPIIQIRICFDGSYETGLGNNSRPKTEVMSKCTRQETFQIREYSVVDAGILVASYPGVENHVFAPALLLNTR